MHPGSHRDEHIERLRPTLDTIIADLRANPLEPTRQHPSVTLLSTSANYRSITARLSVVYSDRRIRLIAKLGNRSDTTREFHTLASIFREAAPALRTPKPYRLYAALGGFLMEDCSGAPLTRLISWLSWAAAVGCAGSRASHVGRACATSLVGLHSLKHLADGEGTERESEISIMMSKLSALEFSGPFGIARETVQRLVEAVPRLANVALAGDGRQTLTHQDFAPHNLVFRRRTIIMLDLADARRGYPEEDVARFLAELDTLGAILRPRRRTRLVTDVRRAFEAAYDYPLAGDRMALFGIKAQVMMLLTIQQFSRMGRFLAPWHALAATHLRERLTKEAACCS
jgi:hypothetical protein